MVEKKIAPYGSWKSPITSDLIVAEATRLGQIILDGDDIYWEEGRPSEGGRVALVKSGKGGKPEDVTPPPFYVRTRVHEYGGGSFTVVDGTIYFANFTDQRIYRQRPGEDPAALTPESKYRYADLQFDPVRGNLICVLEDHSLPGQEAKNSLIRVDLKSGQLARVLASGNDFYASPRLSPDGKKLAYLTWNHPNMPWDGTELWVAEVNPDGSLANPELVAGGIEESIFQPEWSPDGTLYFVSDRTGWWNIYRLRNGQAEPLIWLEAEFGRPQWVFGSSTYGFASDKQLICAYTQAGIWKLASIDTVTRQLEDIETPYTYVYGLRVRPGYAAFVGGSATEPSSVIKLDLASKKTSVLRRSSRVQVDTGYLSIPRSIEFSTARGLTAFGLYYPPQNKEYAAPQVERPPLLVMSHGGPTSATASTMALSIQYWTSRGIAVLDVNYGGSTGYGRSYRTRLNGQWGVVDVEDCSHGAEYLVKQGEVDRNRLMITGGSAGGYTTLCALTFGDTFKAGASHFGIGDLEALAKDTHKFESRYLDSMIGPYPARKDLYDERSPLKHAHRLSRPVIFFQGLDDPVVPPAQSQTMFEAVRAKELPTAYLAFEGEQHGFRKAENIKRSLDAELYFYSRVFAFELAEPVEPVEIENL